MECLDITGKYDIEVDARAIARVDELYVRRQPLLVSIDCRWLHQGELGCVLVSLTRSIISGHNHLDEDVFMLLARVMIVRYVSCRGFASYDRGD